MVRKRKRAEDDEDSRAMKKRRLDENGREVDAVEDTGTSRQFMQYSSGAAGAAGDSKLFRPYAPFKHPRHRGPRFEPDDDDDDVRPVPLEPLLSRAEIEAEAKKILAAKLERVEYRKRRDERKQRRFVDDDEFDPLPTLDELVNDARRKQGGKFAEELTPAQQEMVRQAEEEQLRKIAEWDRSHNRRLMKS